MRGQARRRWRPVRTRHRDEHLIVRAANDVLSILIQSWISSNAVRTEMLTRSYRTSASGSTAVSTADAIAQSSGCSGIARDGGAPFDRGSSGSLWDTSRDDPSSRAAMSAVRVRSCGTDDDNIVIYRGAPAETPPSRDSPSISLSWWGGVAGLAPI